MPWNSTRFRFDNACKQGFVHEQALACEKMGNALYGWPGTTISQAMLYLERARGLYAQWGVCAKIKVDQVTLQTKKHSQKRSGSLIMRQV